MNKKHLIGAMALPLLVAACSQEDLLTTPQNEEGQYDVAKVDVSLTLDDAQTRLATGWNQNLEAGKDELGFAWLGYAENGTTVVGLNGKAYQNHPLYTQTDGSLKPATSIYVGKYYTYYPYNESVVQVAAVPFSLQDQPLASGDAGYDGSAKNSVWISPTWTEITVGGDINGDNAAGRESRIKISPRQFTNKVGLNFNYKNYEIEQGNTSINSLSVALKQGETVVSVPSFSYAPTVEVNADDWAGSVLAASVQAMTPGVNGTTDKAYSDPNSIATNLSVTTGVYNLTTNGHEIVPETVKANEGWETFYFNALPSSQTVGAGTKVEIVMNTTYGILTINKPVSEIAYTLIPKKIDGVQQYYPNGDMMWEYKADGDGVKATDGKLIGAVNYDRSFLQVLGSTGKLQAEVDFSKAVMDGMCVIDDAHLQKLLNYYIAKKKGNSDKEISEEKNGTDIILNLNATDGVFRLSTTSIDLLRTINKDITTEKLVSIQPCKTHGNPDIVIFVGEDSEGVKDNNEVRDLNLVFESQIANVTLDNEAWTWNNTAKKNFGYVKQITNEGTIAVASTNVESIEGYNFPIVNDGTININSVAKTKVNITNNGIINVAEDAELRAYGVVVNEVTEITGVRQGNWGVINNSGVIGIVADVDGEAGEIHNYGLIEHKTNAITWVTTNQTDEVSFAAGMSATNKLGIINIAEVDASVSITNTTNKGIITYTWDATEDGVYVTPENVKYNYLIVEDDITFNADAEEILYLEFAGKRTTFTAGQGVLTGATDPLRLNGVVVAEGNSVQLEKGNYLTTKAAYVKGTIYNGGTFAVTNNNFVTYFGGNTTTDIENVVKQAK